MVNKNNIAVQTSMKNTKQQGFSVVASVLGLLFFAAIIAGGYYIWKQQHTEITLLHQYVEKIESQLGVKDEAVREFRSSLSKLTSETQSQDVILSDHLRTLEDELNGLSKRVNRMASNMTGENWLLSEVEFLLKMADQRILIKEDVKGALQLMRKAERLILEMPQDDRGLMNVRVAISKDIAMMEAYRSIDVPGTYAELAALSSLIEKLPLVPTHSSNSAEKTSADDTLSKINETFAGYITIRKHDTAELAALLSPEQRLNMRDSLRLAVDQAQTGLLRGDQRVYDESLSRIRRWVLQYFVTEDLQTQQAIRRLEDLVRVRVEFDLPAIAISQQELKRYISDRMRLQNH